MRKKELTRQMLEELGIVECTLDGRVFKATGEVKYSKLRCRHKYGEDKIYPGVPLYNSKTKECRNAVLSNVIWAWFNGEIDVTLDIDHINDNPWDNRLENLQQITRKENIRKRKKNGANQWNCK